MLERHSSVTKNELLPASPAMSAKSAKSACLINRLQEMQEMQTIKEQAFVSNVYDGFGG